MTLKINKDLPGHPKGSEVILSCDAQGTPLDSWWRRRLKDAKWDNCCSIKKEQNKKDTSKSKTTKSKKG